jgi:hypothetical protein
VNPQGIQILDLSEHDREQIRKWGALESARSSQQEVNRPPVASEAAVTPPAPMPTVQSSMEACLIAPTLPARVARTRPTPALADALWGLLIGTICFGALFFFRDVASRSLSTGSTGNPSGSVAMPKMQDNPASPPQTSDSSSSRFSENGIAGHRTSPASATRRKPPADLPAAKSPMEKTNADPADSASATFSSAPVRAARSQSDARQTDSALLSSTRARLLPFWISHARSPLSPKLLFEKNRRANQQFRSAFVPDSVELEF